VSGKNAYNRSERFLDEVLRFLIFVVFTGHAAKPGKSQDGSLSTKTSAVFCKLIQEVNFYEKAPVHRLSAPKGILGRV